MRVTAQFAARPALGSCRVPLSYERPMSGTCAALGDCRPENAPSSTRLAHRGIHVGISLVLSVSCSGEPASPLACFVGQLDAGIYCDFVNIRNFSPIALAAGERSPNLFPPLCAADTTVYLWRPRHANSPTSATPAKTAPFADAILDRWAADAGRMARARKAHNPRSGQVWNYPSSHCLLGVGSDRPSAAECRREGRDRNLPRS